MNTISILGSGWLGLPLAKEFSKTCNVKLSTTTISKINTIKYKNIIPYVINIDNSLENIEDFFNSNILIINIPSKNIKSFKNFIEKLEKSPIKKVIFISSTSVYKNNNQLLEIESLFLKIKNIKTTILRFAGLIGYNRNLVKHFQNRIVQNSKSAVNMIHRDDCINIIKQIIQKNIFGEIFNCCASSHPTKEEFYKYCASVSQYKIPLFDNKKNDNLKIVNNQKLKDVLKYEFIHDDLLKIKYHDEFEKYLEETNIIDFSNKEIKLLAKKLRKNFIDDENIAKSCFLFVRDEINHSGDFKDDITTLKASDVLRYKTGWCYAKSHLLAALLRANNIPAGFCYQRLKCNEYKDDTYCLHGLNAIYFQKYGWYKVDPRGNKKNVDAQFNLPHEKLAFTLTKEEFDLPTIYAHPLKEVVNKLTICKSYDMMIGNFPDIKFN